MDSAPPRAAASASPEALAARARAACLRLTGRPATFVVQAPGRVNLIGEHTDYNDGLALPLAINRWTVLAGRPRSDRRIRVSSDRRPDETAEFPLEPLVPGSVSGWGALVAGVADSLATSGHSLTGWEGALVSDVPTGSGLSSSASLEMAVAAAFCEAGGLAWDPVGMARAGQRAEHLWAGIQCGLMDQLVIAAAVPRHALRIDFRTLATSPVPLPAGATVVVLDTGCRRRLATSAYNRRLAECREAAAAAGVASLRDLDPGALDDLARRVGEVPFRRARHVVTENRRVLAVAAALQAGDLVAAGRAMSEGHRSLRDDYEVSGPELDSLVALALGAPGCLGARLTGAGFGGCAVALVASDAAGEFRRFVLGRHPGSGSDPGDVFVVEPPGGAGPFRERG